MEHPASAELVSDRSWRQICSSPLVRASVEPRSWLQGLGSSLACGATLGLSVGGFAAIATPRTLNFFDDTGVGGGWNLAARLYVRGGWPRGFGIGAAMGMLVIEGVAMATPRLEAFYRFVVLSHLSLRLNAVVGGLFLWDTVLGDGRPGPPARTPSTGTSAAYLLGVGVSIGWSSEAVQSRRRVRQRP